MSLSKIIKVIKKPVCQKEVKEETNEMGQCAQTQEASYKHKSIINQIIVVRSKIAIMLILMTLSSCIVSDNSNDGYLALVPFAVVFGLLFSNVPGGGEETRTIYGRDGSILGSIGTGEYYSGDEDMVQSLRNLCFVLSVIMFFGLLLSSSDDASLAIIASCIGAYIVIGIYWVFIIPILSIVFNRIYSPTAQILGAIPPIVRYIWWGILCISCLIA